MSVSSINEFRYSPSFLSLLVIIGLLRFIIFLSYFMCDLVEDTERLLWGKLRVSDAGLTSNQVTGRAGGESRESGRGVKQRGRGCFWEFAGLESLSLRNHESNAGGDGDLI